MAGLKGEANPNFIHGASTGGTRTPEYIAWQSIRTRCLNPKSNSYYRYGGRGITMCEAWQGSFETFLKDAGPRPSTLHSIDRLDNDKGYEPGNCRWATAKEQARNRRTSRLVEYNGMMLSLVEACELAGVNYDAAKYRLYAGKPFDVPIRRPKKRLENA